MINKEEYWDEYEMDKAEMHSAISARTKGENEMMRKLNVNVDEEKLKKQLNKIGEELFRVLKGQTFCGNQYVFQDIVFHYEVSDGKVYSMAIKNTSTLVAKSIEKNQLSKEDLSDEELIKRAIKYWDEYEMDKAEMHSAISARTKGGKKDE